jgi:hypothetical protein
MMNDNFRFRTALYTIWPIDRVKDWYSNILE